MSASNPSISNIINVLNKLSYEPVLDSDAAVKSWIASHNSGLFSSFINGSFQQPNEQQAKSSFDVKNPFSGAHLAKVVNCDKETLNLAIESATTKLADWRKVSPLERGRIIYNIARNVQKHMQIITSCESVQSGRTSREVKDLDISNIVKTLYYYAGSVGLNIVDDEAYEPVGLVAVVGYYDSSLLSLIGKVAASLATGNVCLVVPHKLTPLSSFIFLDICIQSGVPSGVINMVANDNDEILKWISKDPRVNSISFDGKFQTCQDSILSQSFVHPNKQVLLSCEGKSSLVIYDSADIDSAVECVVDGCFYSNGQHRYSLNKVFIQENIYEDVSQRLSTRFNKLRVGNHLDKCNDFGPVINSNDLTSFKEALQQNGADIKEFKGSLQENSSGLIAPTIIKNVALNSQINLNEVNGPYIITIPFRTVKESVELINCSRLGSSKFLPWLIYHSNKVMEVAYLLNVGSVWINGFPIERGVQPRKQSGNYQILGVKPKFKSLRNFLKPKWDNLRIDNSVELDQALQQLKLFGSVTPSQTIPSSQNLNVEKTYKLYVGGKQTRPDTQASKSVFLPNKKDLYCLVADASRKDVRNAVEAASSAFNSWWKRPNHNKAQIIYYFGENLSVRASEFVSKLELLTQKSKQECEKEFKFCTDVIFHFASICDKYTGKLNDTTEYGYLLESTEPLGVISIVCGQNSINPLLTFVLHLIAAITYGNSVIIVPDETTPIPALDLYEVFDTSDMPGGVVNILTGNKHHLTKYLCEHQQINSVWYLNDSKELSDAEVNALRFIKYTSSFSQKQNWLVNNSFSLISDKFVDKTYLKELELHSTQSKYINIPMGTIFAN